MAVIFGIDLKAPVDLSALKQRFTRVEGSNYYLFIGALVITVIIFIALTNSFASKREARVSRRKAELNEFLRLAGEYKGETASIEHLRAKLRVSGEGVSTGTLIEEIGAELGIKKNITSFKPAEESGEGLQSGYMEKGVQVDIEGVTLNQVVNLLYRIRAHRNLLLIKDFSMKAHFANPDLLDLTVQVVLVTRYSLEG
ncbi:MAG: hypothetical protein V3V95_00275 [Thermodesulfobacteriota bacterium]